MTPKPILIIEILMFGMLALLLVSGCSAGNIKTLDPPILKTLEYKENKSATLMDTYLHVFMNNSNIRIKAFCIVYFEKRFIVCNEVKKE